MNVYIININILVRTTFMWFHILYDFTYDFIYDSHILEQHMVRKYDLINRHRRPYYESYVVPYMIWLYMIVCIWFNIWFEWYMILHMICFNTICGSIYDRESYMIWLNNIYDLISAIYDLNSNHIWLENHIWFGIWFEDMLAYDLF